MILRRRRNRYAALVVVSFLAAALVGCSSENSQSTFNVKGPVAQSQLDLFLYWILPASIFVLVIVGGILIYTAIRYRRRPGDPIPPQTHGNTPLEIGWTVLPAIVLAVVAVPTVLTIFDNANSPDEAAMKVDAIAHQWWFEFRYDDPADPERQIVTAGEMHIPVGEIINLNLESIDVLHSFWVPNLAGKVDMVPNNPNTMWIQADETGEYFGQCAEFCGVSHANMRFRVFAESRAEFDDWLQRQGAAAADPVDPLALEGKAFFEGAGQCFACHTVAGSKRARGTIGPNLTHMGSRLYLSGGLIDNTQVDLRRWLTDPEEIKPGNLMARSAAVYTDPEKALTEVQISALVAYLRGLK